MSFFCAVRDMIPEAGYIRSASSTIMRMKGRFSTSSPVAARPCSTDCASCRARVCTSWSKPIKYIDHASVSAVVSCPATMKVSRLSRNSAVLILRSVLGSTPSSRRSSRSGTPSCPRLDRASIAPSAMPFISLSAAPDINLPGRGTQSGKPKISNRLILPASAM